MEAEKIIAITRGCSMILHNSMYWNGALIPENQAIYSAFDRIRLGDGVFDTMLCKDAKALHIALHWERLRDNCNILAIPFSMELDAFQNIAQGLLSANDALSGRYALNSVISRGEAQRGLLPPDPPASPSFLMRLSALSFPVNKPPLHGHIVTSVRRNEGSLLSRIKSLNYGDNILALQEAQRHGANEAIMLNNAGYVTCASAGNIFAISGGQIVTPPLSDGVLDGVARRIFMQRYAVIERRITPEELMGADHVFLTNSIRGAAAFDRLDGKDFSPLPLDIDPEFHIV